MDENISKIKDREWIMETKNEQEQGELDDWFVYLECPKLGHGGDARKKKRAKPGKKWLEDLNDEVIERWTEVAINRKECSRIAKKNKNKRLFSSFCK